nr:type II toxin-antitoxin system PemK/MazF family toxin [Lentilactobacillus kisonensis]
MGLNNNYVILLKITSKYQNKSSSNRQYYYKIMDWQQANLSAPSYIDVHQQYAVSQKQILSHQPIGKLTTVDVVHLNEFVQKLRQAKLL